MVYGQWLFRNLWEGAWWPAPPSQLFLHLCCSSNQSPQLKCQQVGLYQPEVGESRAVRGQRPAWSPSSVDICPSATPHGHAPPCPLAGCAGMPFLDFLTAFCQLLYPQHHLLSSLASPHPRAGQTTHLLSSLAAAASACQHPESTVNKSWMYPDL